MGMELEKVCGKCVIGVRTLGPATNELDLNTCFIPKKMINYATIILVCLNSLV
jgi:hypothetical protein